MMYLKINPAKIQKYRFPAIIRDVKRRTFNFDLAISIPWESVLISLFTFMLVNCVKHALGTLHELSVG